MGAVRFLLLAGLSGCVQPYAPGGVGGLDAPPPFTAIPPVQACAGGPGACRYGAELITDAGLAMLALGDPVLARQVLCKLEEFRRTAMLAGRPCPPESGPITPGAAGLGPYFPAALGTDRREARTAPEEGRAPPWWAESRAHPYRIRRPVTGKRNQPPPQHHEPAPAAERPVEALPPVQPFKVQ